MYYQRAMVTNHVWTWQIWKAEQGICNSCAVPTARSSWWICRPSSNAHGSIPVGKKSCFLQQIVFPQQEAGCYGQGVMLQESSGLQYIRPSLLLAFSWIVPLIEKHQEIQDISLWKSSDTIFFDHLRIEERNRNEPYFLVQLQKAFKYTR